MRQKSICILFTLLAIPQISPLFAQTQQIDTGVANLSILSYSDKSETLDDYFTFNTIHNTLSYRFYNDILMAKTLVIFPNFAGVKIPSSGMEKINNSIVADNRIRDKNVHINKDQSTSLTALGATFGISYAFDILSNLELNLSAGPHILYYNYSVFGLDRDDTGRASINKKNINDFYQPLNPYGFGLGLEGEASLSYFFNESTGINVLASSSVVSIFNSMSFSETPNPQASISYTDDRLGYMFTLSLGLSLR